MHLCSGNDTWNSFVDLLKEGDSFHLLLKGQNYIPSVCSSTHVRALCKCCIYMYSLKLSCLSVRES